MKCGNFRFVSEELCFKKIRGGTGGFCPLGVLYPFLHLRYVPLSGEFDYLRRRLGVIRPRPPLDKDFSLPILS